MSQTACFRFSEHFGITPDAEDDWFDLLLTADTQLFVDPFRVYAASEGPFAGAHDELIAFFQRVMGLLASSGLQPGTAHFQAAERLLLFPEPAEFCLGFGNTPLGIGSGKRLRDAMVGAAARTINEGREAIRHFEEMVLFQESIGPDRVSDIACNVLKDRFIAYTQQVCQRHGVPMQQIAVPHAAWDADGARWDDQAVELPLNPYTGRAVLLVPKRFLRHLSIVTPDDFWDYAFLHYGEQIRAEFNYDIAQTIKHEEVARLARQHPDMARSYIRHFEDGTPDAYDAARPSRCRPVVRGGSRAEHPRPHDVSPGRRSGVLRVRPQVALDTRPPTSPRSCGAAAPSRRGGPRLQSARRGCQSGGQLWPRLR